jgi:hypothetical protein
MPHLPPAYHETRKHNSPNETKIKEKQNETIPDSNSNLTQSMTHHNQTKKRTTCFLRIQVGEECTSHWGVLRFCHSYLVDSSSSKVLPGSHENRVGTSFGRLVGCQCLIEVQSWFGAHMSIVTLLFIVETPPLSWVLRGVWSFCSLLMF